MGCDYYVQTELAIEFKDKDGKINFIYTNRELQKGYIHQSSDYDSDDDFETMNKKYSAEIERKIKDNTYNKILFENGEWIKESYKTKYHDYLLNLFTNIHQFIKVYKKHSAWKRM